MLAAMDAGAVTNPGSAVPPSGAEPVTDDASAMALALVEAAAAPAHGDVPVGAVALVDGRIVASRHNERERRGDPTAHAEILALADAAAALGTWRLGEVTLVVTLEPCPMCAGAMVQARIDRCLYGARDPKKGADGSVYEVLRHPGNNHRVDVTGGVLGEECGRLLSDFFRRLREG